MAVLLQQQKKFNTLKILHSNKLYIDYMLICLSKETKAPASCWQPLAYLQYCAAHAKQLTGEKWSLYIYRALHVFTFYHLQHKTSEDLLVRVKCFLIYISFQAELSYTP